MLAETSRTWAEIHLDRLEHNYRTLRAPLAPGVKFLGVVKANAYGHGAIPVAHKLETWGAEYLAVACLSEAIELRQAGITTPILILGYTSPELTEQLIHYNVTQCLYNADLAEAFSDKAVAAGRSLKVHLKADTGMSRLGFLANEAGCKDAAAAIPVHMDWILFDACYMGCVEVAYEFRGVTDKIIFSPAEVISTGFDYSKMAEYLLADGQDTEGFAEAYYRMYLNDSRGGDWQSATITVLDCSKIEVLASTCSALFSRYGGILATMEEGDIQRYYRHEKPYFYDLQDILVHAGISGAEASSLQAALDGCIPYKAATPHFLAGEGGFDITAYSGLGMYLPGMGAGELDEYYKGLAWNKATGLVK